MYQSINVSNRLLDWGESSGYLKVKDSNAAHGRIITINDVWGPSNYTIV